MERDKFQRWRDINGLPEDIDWQQALSEVAESLGGVTFAREVFLESVATPLPGPKAFHMIEKKAVERGYVHAALISAEIFDQAKDNFKERRKPAKKVLGRLAVNKNRPA